ncbi:mitochondrial inner membrane protease subunit-like protein, partial [Dinothrombium tinctorium]
CEGISMEPTIRSNDVLLSSQWAVYRNNIERLCEFVYKSSFPLIVINCRGNVVIARSPDDPNRLICKRIVGMEGDKIGHGLFAPSVPKGHVWLEGDNKLQSNDSRKYGAVPMGLIIGKVIYRVCISNGQKIQSNLQFVSGISVR